MEQQDRTRHVVQRASRDLRAAPQAQHRAGGLDERARHVRVVPPLACEVDEQPHHLVGDRSRVGCEYLEAEPHHLLGVHPAHPPRHDRFTEAGRGVDPERGQDQRVGDRSEPPGEHAVRQHDPGDGGRLDRGLEDRDRSSHRVPAQDDPGSVDPPDQGRERPPLVHQTGATARQRRGPEAGKVDRDHAPPAGEALPDLDPGEMGRPQPMDQHEGGVRGAVPTRDRRSAPRDRRSGSPAAPSAKSSPGPRRGVGRVDPGSIPLLTREIFWRRLTLQRCGYRWWTSSAIRARQGFFTGPPHGSSFTGTGVPPTMGSSDRGEV